MVVLPVYVRRDGAAHVTCPVRQHGQRPALGQQLLQDPHERRTGGHADRSVAAVEVERGVRSNGRSTEAPGVLRGVSIAAPRPRARTPRPFAPRTAATISETDWARMTSPTTPCCDPTP